MALAASFSLHYADMPFASHQKWEQEKLPVVMQNYAADDAFLALKIGILLGMGQGNSRHQPQQSQQQQPRQPNNRSRRSNRNQEQFTEAPTKLVFPCNALIKKGECKRENCEYSHSIKTCDLCQVMSTSEQGWTNHINGKKHRMALKSKPEIANPKSEFYCGTCETAFVSNATLQYHLKSPDHRKRLRLNQFNKSKESAQSDKDGISIVGPSTLDLGVLDKVGDSVRLDVEVENSNSAVAAMFHSVSYPNKGSDACSLGFTPTAMVKIPSNRAVTLRLAATATRLGYFQTEAIFTFGLSGEYLTIARTITVYVGDKKLYEELKPKQVYQRKVVQPGLNTSHGVVPAGDIAELRNETVKYVKNLGFYDVPDKIRKIISAPTSAREVAPHHKFTSEFFATDFSVAGSYQKYFSSLIHAEEAQLELDIREYSMKGTKLDGRIVGGGRSTFVLVVPGLAEARPSVLKGDSVFVQYTGRKGKVFQGRAVEIREFDVVLKFANEFENGYLPNTLYDVEFSYNRSPWRRMQQAVELDSSVLTQWDSIYRGEEAIQKSKLKAPLLKIADEFKLKPYNKLVWSNSEQRRAVSIIVSGLHHPMPFLLFGVSLLGLYFSHLGQGKLLR